MGDTIGKRGDERPEPVREVLARAPSLRRDPRADPDDDEEVTPAAAAPIGRVDVVLDRSEDRGSAAVDSLTNAALSLRRELAKLHQQAAAVERTIEDQRRERSDALERVEHATIRANELEQKLEKAEAEVAQVRRLHESALDDLQHMRSERDDLARAVEAAKAATEDLLRAREEAETLREAHDEALRAASTYEAELGEIRKREQAGAQKLTDGEAELSSYREKVERASAELIQLREETTQNRSDLARLRGEATTAAEALAKAREEAERERAAARDQLERLERAVGETRFAEAKLAETESELGSLRREAEELRATTARLERDVEAARHTRDVNIERATMAERETEGVRKELERRERELDAAISSMNRADAKATGALARAQAIEDSVRQLRDEVTQTFARWRAPSIAPAAGSVPPPTRVLQEPIAMPPTGDREPSEPPATKRPSPSFPLITAEARPLSMPTPLPPAEDGWSSVPPPSPEAAQKTASSRPPPKSAPPGLAAVLVTGETSEEVLDMRDILSVPPSAAPPPPPPLRTGPPGPPPVPARARPSSGSLPLPTPPPLPSAAPLAGAGARRASIPPAVYPSVPPLTPAEPSVVTAPGSSPDPAPSSGFTGSKERADLLEQLTEPGSARYSATALREHPDWLRGRPPVILLEALTSLDYDVEAPVFEVARMWEREPVCRALIALLRDEPDPKLREHLAWLLKHLGAPSALPSLVDLASNDAEAPGVRRWLLEAIERLVATRSVGWSEVGDLLGQLVRSPDPGVRDGVISVLSALDRSEEKRRMLLELLRTDDDEVVLSSAVQALASALPIEIDPAVTERLLGHPSARVQRSVVDFIERSKRASKNA